MANLKCDSTYYAGCDDIKNGDTTINNTITNAVNYILYFAGAIAIIMIVVSGIQLATSAGSDEKIKKAKTVLVASLIGLSIVILAWTLVNFVVVNI